MTAWTSLASMTFTSVGRNCVRLVARNQASTNDMMASRKLMHTRHERRTLAGISSAQLTSASPKAAKPAHRPNAAVC